MVETAESRDQLVRLARGGDHEAFDRLAATVVSRMRGTARLLLRDPSRADDAVQEALVSAWRSLPGLREPERFDAWLHRLLINACYRTARRERRYSLAAIPMSVPERKVSDGSTDVADRDELERAFRGLTDEQRAVIVLVYYADLSLADAATALGVPTSTAKSRLYRALEAVRAALAADERSTALMQGRSA